MIQPTKGRVLYFYPGKDDPLYQPPTGGEPFHLTAFVTKVHGYECVNLGVLMESGHFVHEGRQDVKLLQDGDTAVAGESYAAWMPFQKGQAMKTQELEKKLDEANKPQPYPNMAAPTTPPPATVHATATVDPIVARARAAAAAAVKKPVEANKAE